MQRLGQHGHQVVHAFDRDAAGVVAGAAAAHQAFRVGFGGGFGRGKAGQRLMQGFQRQFAMAQRGIYFVHAALVQPLGQRFQIGLQAGQARQFFVEQHAAGVDGDMGVLLANPLANLADGAVADHPAVVQPVDRRPAFL